jgi:hypothetical protein
MGWTTMHRNTPVKDWFASEMSNDYTVLEVKIVHRTELYAAIKRKDGSVFCLVALLKYSKGYWNFSYKYMSEFDMPYYLKCPQSILNKLTPIDDENCIAWRKKCIEYKQTVKEERETLKRIKKLL